MQKNRLLAMAGGFAILALAGCGGSSTNSSLYPNTDGDPFIAGLSPLKAVSGAFNEESGLAPSASSNVGYATTAIASTAVPIPSIKVGSTIPLGWAPGAQLLGITAGAYDVATATPANGTVVFKAAVTNGQKGGVVTPIDPSSLVLTTPENVGFKQPLTFDKADIGVGSYPNGQYNSASFTLPFSTTGLHTLVASVSDTASRTTTTTFSTIVLAPGDAAILVQVTDAAGNAIPGATVSITNSIAAFGEPATITTDSQGVAVLFAAPGSQTVTAKSGAKTGTGTFTLTAGSLSAVDSMGGPLTVAFP